MNEDIPLWMVEDEATLAQVAARLAGASAIGVDTESDSFYSYREKVCLLQISDLHTDYVIDPLAIRDLSLLAPVMADPAIVKVFHGADYDVVCLKRDFRFEIHNLFDTMIAAQLLGMHHVGLADLLAEIFGEEIEKKYQRYDWSIRPLLPEHIEYARGDTHWLLALREILTHRLVRRNRLGHHQEECRALENREWTNRGFDPDGYLDVKNARKLADEKKRVLRRLWLYRDEQARKSDRPPFKIIGDADLLLVAETLPTDRAKLDAAMPGKDAMKRRHADALIAAVRAGLADDFEIPARERRRQEPLGAPVRLHGRHAERAFEALKKWRNDLCDSDPTLTPVSVIANAELKAIAHARPTNTEEMAACAGVRDWQVRDFGEAILAVLDAVAPVEGAVEGKPRRRKR